MTPLPSTPPSPSVSAEFITRELLDRVSAQARRSPRRRKNHNFHPDDGALCQRLLNAMEPDAYIPPHRHLDPNKDETLILLRGRLGLILFDPEGRITDRAVLTAGGDIQGVTLPHGTFHAWICLKPGSVFFEAKAGPYVPVAPEERAPWAPAEGDPAAPAYLEQLRGLVIPGGFGVG